MKVSINEIKILDGRRKIDESHVAELSKSIEELGGLLNPITISKDYILIAGAHRLEAHKLLGWTEIEANMMELDDLHRELAEIDENLMRNELHYLEKSDLLKRRKEIYEGLHPETKAGIAQAVGMNKAIGNNVSAESAPTFTEDTAKKSGLSERTIQVDLQIANNLTDKAKETIKQTDIRKTDALKLARMDADKQNKIAEQIESGEAKSIAEAEINLGETKLCSKCGIEKPLSDFDLRNDTGKHKSWCNECRRQFEQKDKERREQEERELKALIDSQTKESINCERTEGVRYADGDRLVQNTGAYLGIIRWFGLEKDYCRNIPKAYKKLVLEEFEEMVCLIKKISKSLKEEGDFE